MEISEEQLLGLKRELAAGKDKFVIDSLVEMTKGLNKELHNKVIVLSADKARLDLEMKQGANTAVRILH